MYYSIGLSLFRNIEITYKNLAVIKAVTPQQKWERGGIEIGGRRSEEYERIARKSS